MNIHVCRLAAALFSLATICMGTSALAQPMPFNEAGVTMGHWHLISKDMEANKKLFMAMGGHYYVGDGERYVEVAKSQDKEFLVIEGASHGFTPCRPCEKTPGQYGNSVRNLFDYVAKWMNDRF